MEQAVDEDNQLNYVHEPTCVDRDAQASAYSRKHIELNARYSQTGNLAILDEAICQMRLATEMVEDPKHKAPYFHDLCRVLRLKSERTSDLDVLDLAIEAGRQSLAAMTLNSQLEPLYLSNLSDSLAGRFDLKGQDNDLQEALQLARDAVEASSSVGQYRAAALDSLRLVLSMSYKVGANVRSLSEAISISEILVKESSEDNPNHAVYHNNLAYDLEIRYQGLHAIADLEACIHHMQKAVAVAPMDSAIRFQSAGNLNEYLRVRAKVTESIADLDQVVTANAQLATEIPLHHGQRFNILVSLARAYRDRYQRTLSREDLGQSISTLEEAAAIENIPDRKRCIAWMDQSSLLEMRDEPGDIDRAVHLSREALKLGSMERCDHLVSLSNRLGSKFSSSGRLSDIDEAIGLAREAVEVAPANHPSRPGWLHNVGLYWGMKATVTNTEACLDQAIKLIREAMKLADLHHTDLSMFLDSLSTRLSLRYDVTGNSADVEEAVQASRAAVATSRPGNVNRLIYLNSLSNRLRSRYRISKILADLDDAIAAISEAIDVAPEDDVYLNTLSSALTERYEATGDVKDIDKAIFCSRKITHLRPKTDARYVNSVRNLGVSIMVKYNHSVGKDHVLLEQALQLARDCVDLTPTDHRDLPENLNVLGERIFRQVQKVVSALPDQPEQEASGLYDEIEKEALRLYNEAMAVFQRSFNIADTLPQTRIFAGRHAGVMLMGMKQWAAAYDILEKTVDLFRRVSPRSLSRGDQQRTLDGLSGISASACAAALYADLPAARALEVLEAGRGIIAGLAMNVRNDVTDLASVSPALASEYEESRAAFVADMSTEAHQHSDAPGNFTVDVAKFQQQRIARLEQIESDIRLLPGFERFQLPPTSEDLMDLAKAGPLVCFNVTTERSDAFLVTINGIESIKLPELRYYELKENVQRIIGPSRLSRSSVLEKSKNNKEMRRILRWLWDVAVHPVLQRLGLLTPADGSHLPRLWWVTSGNMGLMPLHAAGDYAQEHSHDCTANYVVSSYIATLKALIYARARQARAQGTSRQKLLVVSMPRTPGEGWKPLNVAGEVDAIMRSYEAVQGSSTDLRHPSAHDVVERLKSHSIVHFACHGDPNTADPSASSLILYKDPETIDTLTVKQLVEITHANAQLAYLSACCTAQHYSRALMDEVIHLGSAFQLIGYPSVIGTLWEADDAAAVTVAEAFYEHFAAADPHHLTADVAARALHRAMLKVRDQKRGRVRRPDHDAIGWAPFIHIGA